MNQNAKTYMLHFGGAMILYAIMLPFAILMLREAYNSPWSIPIALLMLVPIGLALRAWVRFFHSMDELQKKIQLEALAFAFGATALISFAYGLLGNAGFPQLSWVWVMPLMIALWGVGGAVAARRYQ